MYRYLDDFRHADGDLAIGHSISVYTSSAMSTLAAIWSDSGGTVAIVNPFVVPSSGKLDCYSAEDELWVDSGNGVAQPLPRHPYETAPGASGEVRMVVAGAEDYAFITDANIDAAAAIAVTKLAPGTANYTLTTDAGGTTVEWSAAPGVADIADADVADDAAIAQSKLDLAIGNAEVAGNAAIAMSKLDLAISDAEVAADAAINPSKFDVGTNGQVLTTTAGTAGWADPGAGAFPGYGAVGDIADAGASEEAGVSALVPRADHVHKIGVLAAEGDLITHDGATPVVLNVGTDGQVLAAQADGSIAWESTPSGAFPGYGAAGAVADVAAAEADGIATTLARADHAHTIGNTVITNAMVAANAAIAKTKLAALDIVNADVNAAADIAVTKLNHGTASQFLRTNGAGNAVEWATVATAPPLTTKGDIYTRNATVDARLAVGTNGQYLVADSTQTTGIKWATLPSPTMYVQATEPPRVVGNLWFDTSA